MRDIKQLEICSAYSSIMEHDKWIKEIPDINFPSEWKIKILPPFSCAVVRFHVKYKEAFVSIYLDCYNLLGVFGKPYWEVYPYKEDIFRCEMLDTKSLLKAIQYSIKEQIINQE